MGYFKKKVCHLELSIIAQSGLTVAAATAVAEDVVSKFLMNSKTWARYCKKFELETNSFSIRAALRREISGNVK